jgi:hypothetical protein
MISASCALAMLAAAVGVSTPGAYPEEVRQHLTEAADGRLRFRYSKSAAVAAWGGDDSTARSAR